MSSSDLIAQFQLGFDLEERKVMEALRKHLDKVLGKENSKLWQGAPVWFVGENPVAGYSVNKRGVCLLFWNGQNFNSFELHKVGKFFAAEKRYASVADIDVKELKALLEMSKELVWDSVGYMREQRQKSQSK